MRPRIPENNNQRYSPCDYGLSDRLYFGYRIADLDEETGDFEPKAVRFPDFSCNWDRFSNPESVRERENGIDTDGCFSFSTESARYKEMATTCHDPLESNYSHTEIRQLKEEESVLAEPPKKRRLSSYAWSKSKKLEYRQNLVFSLKRELEAQA